ncbi:MAG: hypothetical protein ACPGSI_18490 [Pikeienuella sp.]
MVGNEWVSPVDFWRMSPGQVWWAIEARIPQDMKERQSELSEVVQMVKAAKKKEAEQWQD